MMGGMNVLGFFAIAIVAVSAAVAARRDGPFVGNFVPLSLKGLGVLACLVGLLLIVRGIVVLGLFG